MATETQLMKRMQVLKDKLVGVEEMYPGSLSKQYNICGTPGCKCKDKKNPIKHGPYTNLSYTFRRKNHTKFIRKDLEQNFKRFTSNYKRFREHVEELLECNMKLIDLRSKRK